MAIASTFIYSVMLGVTLLALVQNVSKPKQRQTTYLSALLVLLLIHILGELHIYTGFYQYAPALAGLQFPIRTLLGPALYFYAFATMSPDKQLPSRAYGIALLGPLLVILVMLPFVFGMSAEQKLALATPETRDPELWKIAVTTCLAAMLIFIIFTGTYLAATLRMHAKHREQLMERFSSIEKRSMDWFKIVLLLWGGTWILFASEYTIGFLGQRWFGTGIVLPLFEAVVLLLFTHLALNQPVLADSDKGEPEANIDKRTPSLPEQRMEEIADALNDAMTKEQLFMEDDLSLNRLSEAVSVSENHISETLSQYLNTNFFNFVNSYRIQAAKAQLQNTDKQVSTIAYDVGFNSKSTFNAAFKKIVGDTPTSFRKQSFTS